MIMAKLKEATKHQHDSLESAVSVMDQMFTRTDYIALLTKFYGFYSAIEPKLREYDLSEFGIEVGERMKTEMLKSDLENLGANISDDNDPNAIPTIDSAASAFGAMYVLEGATLGGQVITRHLKQHLALDTTNGGSFFNSYGANVGPMWKAFCAAATEFSEKNDGKMDDVMVETAQATFQSFADRFERGSAAGRSN